MVERNEHLHYRIGTAAVAYKRSLLESLFHWLLDPAQFPELAGGSGKRRQRLKAYELLAGRVKHQIKRFPDQSSRLVAILDIIAEAIGDLTETAAQCTFVSKDRMNSWYVSRGSQPALGPRLLLAVCIAKELCPSQSPFKLAAEELQRNGQRIERRAIEMRIGRLLAHPEKAHVYGGSSTKDLAVLLKQEFLDFKTWREDQRVDRTKMSTAEFDRQFPDYLDRIHPTNAEVTLLGHLFDNFRNQAHPKRLKRERTVGRVGLKAPRKSN